MKAALGGGAAQDGRRDVAGAPPPFHPVNPARIVRREGELVAADYELLQRERLPVNRVLSAPVDRADSHVLKSVGQHLEIRHVVRRGRGSGRGWAVVVDAARHVRSELRHDRPRGIAPDLAVDLGFPLLHGAQGGVREAVDVEGDQGAVEPGILGDWIGVAVGVGAGDHDAPACNGGIVGEEARREVIPGGGRRKMGFVEDFEVEVARRAIPGDHRVPHGVIRRRIRRPLRRARRVPDPEHDIHSQGRRGIERGDVTPPPRRGDALRVDAEPDRVDAETALESAQERSGFGIDRRIVVRLEETVRENWPILEVVPGIRPVDPPESVRTRGGRGRGATVPDNVGRSPEATSGAGHERNERRCGEVGRSHLGSSAPFVSIGEGSNRGWIRPRPFTLRTDVT